MPCRTIRLEDGSVAIMCSRGRQPQQKCKTCGQPAGYLCDCVIDKETGKTCDEPMCGKHRVKVAPGIDYCPQHSMRDNVVKMEARPFEWPVEEV